MKKKAKKYIFGINFFQKWIPGTVPRNTESFQLPAISGVLDGISLVMIEKSGNGPLPTEIGQITLKINNEDVIINEEIREIAQLKNFSFNGTNNRQIYIPTPRPLSGSDQVEITISQNTFWITNPWTPPAFYIHFHYQPKQ